MRTEPFPPIERRHFGGMPPAPADAALMNGREKRLDGAMTRLGHTEGPDA